MSHVCPKDFRNALQHGFTLIELIVVIAVLCILLGTAMPSLRGTLARNQLLGQANEIAGALALARSEAVTRGSQAGICASANGTSCSGDNGGWNNFILVFIDANSNSIFDDGAANLLKSLPAQREVDQTAAPAAFFFTSSGFSTLNAVSIVEVCHENLVESDRCRTVSIAPTGIVTVRHKSGSA